MLTRALSVTICAFAVDHGMVEERVSGLSHRRCIRSTGGLGLTRTPSIWSIHGKLLLPVKLLTDLNTKLRRRRFIVSRSIAHTSCRLCMVHRIRAISRPPCSCHQLTGQFVSGVTQARIRCCFSRSDRSLRVRVIYAGHWRYLVLNGHCQPRRPLSIPGT